MTVWTNITLPQANDWLACRSFNEASAITPIDDGVEDSVFRLDFKDGSAGFLRVFERTEPQGPLEIALRLSFFGLPTCPPVPDPRQRLCGPLLGKHAALYPWIEGDWVENPTLAHIEAIGAFLGQMAKTGPHYCADWNRRNPRGWEWFTGTAQALAPKLDRETRYELEKELSLHLDYWKTPDARALPQGPIHADIFRNNVLFDKNGRLAAVIDWGFCASDFPLLFDLAIVANDWCLQKDSAELDPVSAGALLNARERVHPLTKEERQCWGMALRWAALRFWLSRLYDWHFPRKTNGKRHDPGHFLAILKARQRLKTSH